MISFFFSKNSFDGQLPDEHIELLLRRHWFVLVGWTVAFCALMLLPFALFAFFGTYISRNGFASLYWFFSSVYATFIWFVFSYGVMKYFLDVWIVSDHRIIDTQQVGFFNRVISEMHISRVQDVTTQTAGLVATLLNFGNLEVQTAGEEEKFMFRQIPNPNAIRDIIMEASTQFLKTHPGGAEPGRGSV